MFRTFTFFWIKIEQKTNDKNGLFIITQQKEEKRKKIDKNEKIFQNNDTHSRV